MDKSVDSIGSCSLDVDADSTDFSDTSGSLNLATPSSAKDITREFTSKIRERCQIPQINCQQATTLLDPCSGKINTVLTKIESPDISPAKKPSYLNLACCVNGYSNLTTYDSKLRQNINKSREVSPIRPSANNTLQYCKVLGNLLAPPVPMPVNTTNQQQQQSQHQKIHKVLPSISSSTGKDNNKYKSSLVSSMDNRTMLSQEKNSKILTQAKNDKRSTTTITTNTCVDTVDNIGMGNGTYFKTSKFMTSTIITSSEYHQQASEAKTATTKSFIQQRVERLYGPGALAQGFYSPKKIRSLESTVLCERSNNTSNQQQQQHQQQLQQYSNLGLSHNDLNSKTTINNIRYGSISNDNCGIGGVGGGGGGGGGGGNQEDFENFKNSTDLPVLRHLRPEFRAQLPILSPKRSLQSMKIENNDATVNSVQNGTINNSIHHLNGTDKTATAPVKQIVVEKTINSVVENKKNGFDNLLNDNDNIKRKTVNSIKEIEITPSLPASHKQQQPQPQQQQEQQQLDQQKDQNSSESKKIEIMTKSKENPSKNEINEISQRDGNYFLKILKNEQDRLLQLAAQLEEDMEILIKAEVSEEIIGYLRSASGKARLLATQKMKQFEGLCMNNLNQSPDERFPTTNEDLQGFWDMVMLQVENVDCLFSEIESMRANNWKKKEQPLPPPAGSKLIKRPNTGKSSGIPTPSATTTATGTNKKSSSLSAASSVAAQKREAQRKQLMELKRKQKLAISAAADQQKQEDSNKVEIFVNEQQCS